MLGNQKGKEEHFLCNCHGIMEDSAYEFNVMKQAQGSLGNYESSETGKWQTGVSCVNLSDSGAHLSTVCQGVCHARGPLSGDLSLAENWRTKL